MTILTISSSSSFEPAAGFSQKVRQFSAAEPLFYNPQEILLPEVFPFFAIKRQAEFIAGRLAAQEALRDIGVEDLIGWDPLYKIPQWPEGTIGSITHTRGFARAAVARRGRWTGLGIDSEQVVLRGLTAKFAARILSEEEREAFLATKTLSEAEYLSLVFSAKESLFKCLFPLVRKKFYFKSAKITVEQPGIFTGELRDDLAAGFTQGRKLSGFYHFSGGMVHTLLGI